MTLALLRAAIGLSQMAAGDGCAHRLQSSLRVFEDSFVYISKIQVTLIFTYWQLSNNILAICQASLQ